MVVEDVVVEGGRKEMSRVCVFCRGCGGYSVEFSPLAHNSNRTRQQQALIGGSGGET